MMSQNRRRLTRVVVLILAVSLPAMGLRSSAATHGVLVSTNPVEWTPHVLDGQVHSIARVGDVTVAVGDFTAVRDNGSDVPIPRTDIFAFNSTTGKVSTTFVPQVSGSEVFAVTPAGDGQTVYIGGLFSSVNGVPRTTRVARINVNTGAVVTTFRAPAFDKKVTGLELANGKLWVTGWFSKVAGVPRTVLVALDAETGADTGAANLAFTDTWNGGTVGAADMTLRPDGSKLVIIGNWRNVNGLSRPQIAMVDISGPTAVLDNWATTRFSTTCSSSFETYMWGVDASPDGKYFAVGTTGAYSGGPSTGTLCDTVSRFEFGPSAANAQPTWIAYTGGDTVSDVEVTDTAVYAGGHFRWFNNAYASDAAGQGAVRRMGIAALDPRNGIPFNWNPGRERGWGVWGFLSDEKGLWVGHDTDIVRGETHQRLALFPVNNGKTLPQDNTGGLPGDLYLLGLPGFLGIGFNDDVTKKHYDGGVTASGAFANGGVAWSNVRGAFMADGVLYNFWADKTMTKRTFDGTTFGPATVMGLNGMTSFADELPSVRALWFDRVTGRLYYTLSSNSRLFYRYFTPESGIVGVIRHEAPTGGVNMLNVTGGFLSDGQLYFREGSSLRRANWNDGPVTGTAVTVSGSGVDSQNWSSRALFLYAG